MVEMVRRMDGWLGGWMDGWMDGGGEGGGGGGVDSGGGEGERWWWWWLFIRQAGVGDAGRLEVGFCASDEQTPGRGERVCVLGRGGVPRLSCAIRAILLLLVSLVSTRQRLPQPPLVPVTVALYRQRQEVFAGHGTGRGPG